jgi:hypothetical protein
MELHLGVIDDPVKGRAEANSRLVRDQNPNNLFVRGGCALDRQFWV